MITKIMKKSLYSNIILTVVKIVGSYFSASKTLAADAIHCLSDLSTDIIGLVGSRLSNKAPDESHPFGHGKIEYLTSLIISIFIFSLGITIFKNSFETRKISNIVIGLIILLFTIVVKFAVSGYLIKNGKKLNSSILIASGTESRYDTYSSCLAFVFIIIAALGVYYEPLKYADMIGSIVISLFTIKIAITLFLDNSKSLIGEKHVDKELDNQILDIISKYKKVKKVRRITFIKYGNYLKLNLDIEANKYLRLEYLYKLESQIKKDIKTSNNIIKYVDVNIYPEDTVKE